VQSACLTKITSRSRWKFKIKLIVTKFLVPSVSLEPLLGFGNNLFRILSSCKTHTHNCFHPITYGGRHNGFHFRKHPSSCLWYDAVRDLTQDLPHMRRALYHWATTVDIFIHKHNLPTCRGLPCCAFLC